MTKKGDADEKRDDDEKGRESVKLMRRGMSRWESQSVARDDRRPITFDRRKSHPYLPRHTPR